MHPPPEVAPSGRGPRPSSSRTSRTQIATTSPSARAALSASWSDTRRSSRNQSRVRWRGSVKAMKRIMTPRLPIRRAVRSEEGRLCAQRKAKLRMRKSANETIGATTATAVAMMPRVRPRSDTVATMPRTRPVRPATVHSACTLKSVTPRFVYHASSPKYEPVAASAGPAVTPRIAEATREMPACESEEERPPPESRRPGECPMRRRRRRGRSAPGGGPPGRRRQTRRSHQWRRRRRCRRRRLGLGRRCHRAGRQWRVQAGRSGRWPVPVPRARHRWAGGTRSSARSWSRRYARPSAGPMRLPHAPGRENLTLSSRPTCGRLSHPGCIPPGGLSHPACIPLGGQHSLRHQ